MEIASNCIMVLLQCREREWYGDGEGAEAWARDAAEKCVANGFAVLRVPTENWKDVKKKYPSWFTPVLKPTCNRQQIICSINYIHILCPILEDVADLLQTFPKDNVAALTEQGYHILVPEGVAHVSSDIFVVCEASSNIAANLCPRGLRLLYGHYSAPVLWCGFNSAERTTGSKAIVGNAQSLLVLGQCLQRLKLCHIDRTYKALRSEFFALAQRNHICFGVLQHRSQCCDTSRGDDMPLSANEYAPLPYIPTAIIYPEKLEFSVDEALRDALQNITKVRGNRNPFDIVCLRLRMYMSDDDSLLHGNNGELQKHLEAVHAEKVILKNARDACRLSRLVTCQHSSVHGDLEAALATAEEADRKLEAQLEHPVVDWCQHNGWILDLPQLCKVTAMIERGLTLALSGQHLICNHHGTQLHTLDLCWQHFTVTNNDHLQEEPSIATLAETIERSHLDEGHGVSTVLQRHYG